mmetsp:Transcript_27112/g.73299  ORF Transcript_27112/g.73299 Transcript_27112/m.73299 type:complete len:80 (-) Transcript_27112:771-1010(-)
MATSSSMPPVWSTHASPGLQRCGGSVCNPSSLRICNVQHRVRLRKRQRHQQNQEQQQQHQQQHQLVPQSHRMIPTAPTP